MDQDTLSSPDLSPTGKTSIDANVDPDIQIVLTNEENTTNRAIQNVYCLNNLEWYRIGACSNVNLCHRKEIVEEEIVQHTSGISSIPQPPSAIKNMTNSRMKEFFKINWKFVPLKLLIFFWSSAAFSILPYLTIHMKDIGISIDHIALIYAILPFTIFVAPPFVGYLADKMGSFTRVLLIMFLGTGVFHSVLLFVPTSVTISRPPTEVRFSLVNNTASLMWTPCEILEEIKINGVDDSIQCLKKHEIENKASRKSIDFDFDSFNTTFDLRLEKCSFQCPSDAIQVCESLSNMMICSKNEENDIVTLKDISTKSMLEESNTECYNEKLFRVISGQQPLTIAPGCSLDCLVQHPVAFDALENMCSEVEGDTGLTFALYFVFRALATMCLACCFILIDAQTIQMCKEEEKEGKAGALGRQFVYAAISQAIISPVVGQLMDYVSKTYNNGKPSYLVAFIAHDAFLACGMVLLLFTKLDVKLPKATSFEGIKKIFSSLNNCVFLVLMFVIGSMWGFIETFLFVYLKDDMGAPMYLLGLTITVGAVVSIPFLFFSDYLVDRIGQNNTFILALLTYSVRYVGYSYITNPLHALPFEALELFTINLFKIACVQYVGENAPQGLLATMNGISGCIHYGLGKGSGSLIGGYIISRIGSTALTFRYFGVAAAVAGLLLFFYEFGYRKGCKLVFHSNAEETKRKSENLKHNKDNAISISEPLIKSKNISIIKAKSNNEFP